MIESLQAFRLFPMQPVLVWFRRNLRLSDNAALSAAADSRRPVIPVYIVDDEDVGGARRWWLHHSLQSLDRSLCKLGSSLILRAGSAERILSELASETGAAAIYYTKRYEPACRRQEAAIDASLGDMLEIHVFADSLLHTPGSVLTGEGLPYRVFTPFWKTASERGDPPLPLPVPASLQWAEHRLDSAQLSELHLLPTQPDWAEGLRATWVPGESAGLDRIDELEPTLPRYSQYRDRPDVDSTTRLSPYLHFGELSVRQASHGIRRLEIASGSSASSLLRQLYWRDFSYYLLYHFPTLPDKPLREEFEFFPWLEDDSKLRAWQRGRTGYPLVDAGMRQLWQTGWMHNRVRMVVASFLVKDLLIPWQTGAAWFLDTLVDADLANNSASWQWVAGCGSDAAPYFRIFNPALQSSKFDPHGYYARQWIPELCAAGHSKYPQPIVDHAMARNRALEAYQSIKGIRTSKQAP
jgi:deoxyribodipyrimidine photo-lyase